MEVKFYRKNHITSHAVQDIRQCIPEDCFRLYRSLMIKSIRNIEKAIGKKEKEVTESEKKNISVVRKSIVAKKHIKKGEVFSENNITIKRPGTGISPMKWYEIMGMKAVHDFDEDDLIEL